MAEKIKTPLRVALRTKSTIEQWKLNALQIAEEKGLIEVGAIFIDGNFEFPKKSHFFQKFTLNKLNSLVDIDSIFSHLPYFEMQDVEGKQNFGADIIFCSDDESLFCDEKFTKSKYGAWMFGFISNNKLTDENMEVSNPSKTICVALLANHAVLQIGNFRILNYSWNKTLTNVYSEAQEWLSDSIELLVNKISHGNKGSIDDFEIYKVSLLKQIQFTSLLFLNLCKQRLQLLFTKEVWNVGVIPKHISKCLEDNFTDEVIWFPHPTHGIFADPFGVETEDSVKIIFENLDFKNNRGKLSVMEFDKKNYFKNGKTFLEGNEHFSYPYLFEDKGKLFMIPECCQSKKLTLYELNKKDFSIVKETVLIGNIEAVDPSVIYYNNKWWLFCTLKNNKPDLKLHIFYSDTLNGTWQPHLLNPVKIDVSSSRPGGTMFLHNNKLYRPSQDSSTSYGDRIVINEITELSENKFSEKEVAEVLPYKFKTYKNGLHTLSAAGNYTLIDAKKTEVRINYTFFKKLFGRK